MIGYSLAIICLALNVYHESRGEPIEGQLAVAMVTINRLKAQDEADMCKVVFEPGQFAWTAGKSKDGVLNKEGLPKETAAWEKAKDLAVKAMTMMDFTDGATHFHEASLNPRWSKNHQITGQWGAHIFYKRERYANTYNQVRRKVGMCLAKSYALLPLPSIQVAFAPRYPN